MIWRLVKSHISEARCGAPGLLRGLREDIDWVKRIQMGQVCKCRSFGSAVKRSAQDDKFHLVWLHRPRARDGSAERLGGAKSPAKRRGQAAAAIMAALSVERANVGKEMRKCRSFDFAPLRSG
jgi:hypothetical protein